MHVYYTLFIIVSNYRAFTYLTAWKMDNFKFLLVVKILAKSDSK